MSTLQLGNNVIIKGSESGPAGNKIFGSISGIVNAEGIIPTGSIIYTATNPAGGQTPNVPLGYLMCDGSALSKVDYKPLWDAIGSTFNSGAVGGFAGVSPTLPPLNTATQFRVPYLQGTFIRCWDGPIRSSIDPGDTQRTFGSFQMDDFKSHAHSLALLFLPGSGPSNPVSVVGGSGTRYSTNASPTTGGLETRPRNIALMAIIKY